MTARRAAFRSLATAALLTGLVAFVAAESASAAKPEVVSSGTFEGRSRHDASGAASLVRTDAGYLVVLESSFEFDGAPDAKLAFGKDGYKKETLFSPLRENEGAQVYALPESIDPSAYDELWIWCEKFDVPLGVAQLR